MHKNNFNTNKDGADIELYCSYDTDIARLNFEENLEIVQSSGYSTSTIAYYIDYGNVKGADDIEWTIKGTVKVMKAFAKEECYWVDNSEINKMRKAELIDEILEWLARQDSLNVQNFEKLNESFSYVDSFGGVSQVFDLALAPANKTLEYTDITGYSQGDYARVYYSPSDLEKVWGKAPKESDLNNYFSRLFFDAPIYARFEIDGEEYNYYDYCDDEYEWEPEEFAKSVSKDSGIPVSELLEFLPEYPDYN